MKGEWPELPTRVYGAGGPITVRQVRRVRGDDGAVCWGTWDAGKRTIHVERGALIEHRWRVYFHELCHATWDDSGVGALFTEGGLETLCDAVATSRMAEMRHQLGIKDPKVKR